MSQNNNQHQDYSAWKVVALRKELRARGLSTVGRKVDLVQRLAACAEPTMTPPKPIAAVQTPPRSVGKELRALSFSPAMLQPPVVPTVEEPEEDYAQGSTQDMAQLEQQEQHELMWSPQQLRARSPLELDADGPRPTSIKQLVFGNAQLSSDDLDLSRACKPSVSNTEPAATPIRNSSGSLPNSALRRSRDGCTPSSAKKGRISFGQVEIRSYRVSHGGATSTPSKGAYPIGLSWEVANEETKPLAEYEQERVFASPAALPGGSPRRLTEKERRQLLDKVDARSYFEKQASFETEKEELRQLRRARSNVGCQCTSPTSCGTSRCICFKEEVACTDDSCRCTCDNCVNPNRYNFDQDRVNKYRKLRIEEGSYTLQEGGTAAATLAATPTMVVL